MSDGWYRIQRYVGATLTLGLLVAQTGCLRKHAPAYEGIVVDSGDMALETTGTLYRWALEQRVSVLCGAQDVRLLTSEASGLVLWIWTHRAYPLQFVREWYMNDMEQSGWMLDAQGEHAAVSHPKQGGREEWMGVFATTSRMCILGISSGQGDVVRVGIVMMPRTVAREA